MQPRIGIPAKLIRESEIAPPLTGVRVPYLDAVIASGGIPIVIPIIQDEKTLRVLYDGVDGILLTGGEDVNPKHYNEEPHPKLGRVVDARDEVEFKILRWAIEDHMPVLAICRGFQLLNVALGGTLYQDLESQREGKPSHDGHNSYDSWFDLSHELKLESDAKLAQMLGVSSLKVNTLHHQAIKDLAVPLRATGVTPDGLIEAVEMPTHDFVIGVQCHPEMLWQETDTRWRKVFDGFIKAAAE